MGPTADRSVLVKLGAKLPFLALHHRAKFAWLFFEPLRPFDLLDEDGRMLTQRGEGPHTRGAAEQPLPSTETLCCLGGGRLTPNQTARRGRGKCTFDPPGSTSSW